MTTETSGPSDQLAVVVQSARDDAKKESVVGIFIVTFLFTIVGLVVAYLHKPYVPLKALMLLEDSHARAIYKRVYSAALRQRRIKAAWFAFLTAAGLAILIWLLVVGIMAMIAGSMS